MAFCSPRMASAATDASDDRSRRFGGRLQFRSREIQTTSMVRTRSLLAVRWHVLGAQLEDVVTRASVNRSETLHSSCAEIEISHCRENMEDGDLRILPPMHRLWSFCDRTTRERLSGSCAEPQIGSHGR